VVARGGAFAVVLAGQTAVGAFAACGVLLSVCPVAAAPFGA
jgi:hypothetical protein